jgi:Holliday junction resolvasome RuvABC endonuclease subunit
MSKRLVVLGIDPGLESLGWATLNVDGPRVSLGDCGTLHTKAGNPDAGRVATLLRELAVVIRDHQPGLVGVEQYEWQGHARSANPNAMRVSRVVGAVEALVVGYGVVLAQVTRNQALRSVGARSEAAGNANVALLLKFPPRASQHARDAAMVAVAAEKIARTRQ